MLPQRRAYSAATVRLALPLPALTAEVFAPEERAPDDEIPQAAAGSSPAGPTFVPREQRGGDEFADGLDDVFVVRQLGDNRRKRVRAEAQMHERDDDQGEDIDEAEAGRRAARRAAKLEKKRLAAGAAAAAEMERLAVKDEAEAFDYEGAPSLVRGGAGGEEGGGAFGVYKRAMDAPRGLPKRKERLGKSRTFGR
jgi:hypothetical protein